MKARRAVVGLFIESGGGDDTGMDYSFVRFAPAGENQHG